MKHHIMSLWHFGPERSAFEEGKEYTLKVVAEDKAGNIASQTIDISVPSDNTIARVIAPQIEIEKGEQNPLYGGMIFGSDVDTLTLKDNVQGATWYINNKESSPALKDENGSAIYDEHVERCVGDEAGS